MKRLMNCLMLATTLSSLPLWAERATGGGNGGDAFFCADPSRNMVLDYYEGIDRGLYRSFGHEALTIKENFLGWIDLLNKNDVERAKKYKALGLDIIDEINKIESGQSVSGKWVHFVEGDLVDIPDSEELVNPKGCVKKQLIIQTNMQRGEKLLKIQRQLWSELSNVQKAVILTHELVYNEFLVNGAVDSRDARYFNQMVMSGKVAGMSACKYYNFIKTELKGMLADMTFQAPNNGSLFALSVSSPLSCSGNTFKASETADKWGFSLFLDPGTAFFFRSFTVDETVSFPLVQQTGRRGMSIVSKLSDFLETTMTDGSRHEAAYTKDHGMVGKIAETKILDAMGDSGIKMAREIAKANRSLVEIYLQEDTVLSYDVGKKLFSLRNVKIRAWGSGFFKKKEITVKADFELDNTKYDFHKVVIHK